MRDWASHLGRFLRLGLPGLAVYALVLQAFLTGATPAAAFDPTSAPLCAELASGGPGTPGVPSEPHHPSLCVTHCSAATPGFLTGARTAGLPVRTALRATPGPAPDEAAAPLPLHRGPGARAPPQV
jgi:hypothetical protein